MDTSTVLEKYTQDLSNLPLEVKHLLEEIKTKDVHLMEARKRYQAKDNQIHRFIRSNGTLTKHPKEQQLYAKIEEEMQTVQKLQKEKIVLANTALFLVSKHLFNFETDITKLERDELLPPVEETLDSERNELVSVSGYSDSISGSTTPRNGSANGNTPFSDSLALKRLQKRKQIGLRSVGASVGLHAAASRPFKRLKSEDLDDLPKSLASIGSLGIGGDDLQMGMGMNEHGPGNNGEDADNNLYCFCQRVSFGEMIGCDNDDCKFEWFHWSCVGITSPPKDDDIWYCPDCAPKMEKRKKKRKN